MRGFAWVQLIHMKLPSAFRSNAVQYGSSCEPQSLWRLHRTCPRPLGGSTLCSDPSCVLTLSPFQREKYKCLSVMPTAWRHLRKDFASAVSIPASVAGRAEPDPEEAVTGASGGKARADGRTLRQRGARGPSVGIRVSGRRPRHPSDRLCGLGHVTQPLLASGVLWTQSGGHCRSLL